MDVIDYGLVEQAIKCVGGGGEEEREERAVVLENCPIIRLIGRGVEVDEEDRRACLWSQQAVR